LGPRRFRVQQFQQIVDRAPAIVFVKDLDGRHILVNRRFEEVIGIDRDRAIGHTDHDLFPSQVAGDYAAHDRIVIESGDAIEIEEIVELPSGPRTYVSLKFPLTDRDDRIYAVAGIAYDITERRQAQNELRRSLEREHRARTQAQAAAAAAQAANAEAQASHRHFADLLARVTDGFVALDPDWNYTYVNDRAAELLGRRPEDLLGKNYHVEFPEAVGTPFEQAYRRAMKDQVAITMDNYYEPWDRWFENRIYPSQGGLSIFFSEITERKRAERERQQLNDKLARQAMELEERVVERTADLEAANRELESFAYTVSHDLRAPLRSMEGFGQALLEDYADALGKEGREFVRRIAEAAGRMSELIDDLLGYARLSRSELKPARVELDGVVAEAQYQIAAELTSRHAILTVDAPLPAVVGHQRTLVQVIANLISNAAKFVAEGTQPRITVRAQRSRQTVRLWVEDNGIGIAPRHQDQVFRVFERLHGVEAYPGTGIGLAIVRKGVEHMGGKVGIDSKPGHGSRFWFELQAPRKDA
jgi:PAS domain S-box-containing protein